MAFLLSLLTIEYRTSNPKTINSKPTISLKSIDPSARIIVKIPPTTKIKPPKSIIHLKVIFGKI